MIRRNTAEQASTKPTIKSNKGLKRPWKHTIKIYNYHMNRTKLVYSKKKDLQIESQSKTWCSIQAIYLN